MPDGLIPPSRGSRKFAVSLFADLTGYTALCQRLDPEDVERAVAPLMMAMQSLVMEARGTVINVAGDGLYAIFGVPEALADSPERAVRVAQQMREVVDDMSRRVQGITLPDVHIGIAAGEVLVSSAVQYGSWSVIGTSANLASRLCDAASAGEILVDDSCHRLVEREYQWEAARTLSLKGQDTATMAWPLSALAPGVGASPAPQVFVGRTALLSALDSELQSVDAERMSRTVVVRGIAGIGKSSLVRHWLTCHVDIQSWRVECDESRRIDDLQALSDAVHPDRDNERSAYRTRPEPVDRSDPYPLVVHALRARLIDAVAGEPRILVIEDLHASDTILGEFLLDLAKDPLNVPLLVIATWRDEPTGVTTEPFLLGRTLTLEPLERSESDSLFEALLGERVEPEALELVAERTSGHPLMVRESASHLIDLRTRVAGRHAVMQEFRDTLPTTLRMFLAARIDRLDGSVRSIVNDLSALGAHFSGEWVGAVLGRRAEAALPTLAKEGVLVAGELWSFSHDLLREVAYNTLTRTHRADLHRRQLELLPQDADPHLRAEHALAWNQSVSPVDREQYVASTVGAVRETLALAKQLYERQARAALQAARRATSAAQDCVDLDPALTVALWALEAQCLSELGENDDALRLAARAEKTAGDADMPAMRLGPLMTRGYVLSSLRRFEGARQALDEAAQAAERLGDRIAQAEAVRLLADTWRHSLVTRFVGLTEEAYHLFDSAEDARGAGECARTLAYLSSVGGGTRFAKWREIAGRLTNPNDLRATAALAKADALALGARFEFAGYREAGLTLVSAGEALEAPDLVSEGLLNLADAHLHLGEPERASEASLALIELATTLGDRRMRATAAAAAIRPTLRTGNLGRSCEELRIAREMAQEFGPSEEAFIAAQEALWLADRGSWQSAREALRTSVDAFEAGGFSLAALSPRAEEIRIATIIGDAAAGAATAQLVADAREMAAPLAMSFALAVDASARAARGEAHVLGEPPEAACLEERAIRADAEAIERQVTGADPFPLWRRARNLWEQLGYTIWLARAQARSGDVDAARHTLDLLDSPAEARAWALGEAAAS